jgi:general secretion pathway protein B
MSFILYALRKSEIERQRQSGPSMAEFPVAREDRRLPVALIAIGFLLAINVAVVLFFMLRQSPAPATAASQIAAAAPASVTGPPPVSAAPPPAVMPAPQSELQPAQDAAGQYAQPPLELYGEAATQPPDAPDPTLLPDAPVSSPGVTYDDASPDDAPTAPAVPGLPALTVDLHIYTTDPAKRAVFINGRRYTQGAHIAEGPTVEEITPEGAVLSYHGRRFLLPRL